MGSPGPVPCRDEQAFPVEGSQKRQYRAHLFGGESALSAHGQGGATPLFIVMLLLLIGPACFHPVPPMPFEPHEHAPEASWDDLFGAMEPARLFDDAVLRRQLQDLEGAIDRLVWLRLHGDSSPATLYQLGIAFEMDEDFERALGVYDLLLEELDEETYRHDALFRRGLCREALGYTEAALRDYRAIPRDKYWDPADRHTLDLVMGAALLALDRPRRGRPLVLDALKATEGTGELPWARGRALYALAEHTLGEAAEIKLGGSQERLARQVRYRLEALEKADNYLVHVVKTGEPEWILAGLLALGDAWACLYEDLAAAPAPKGLSRWQQEHYDSQLAEQLQLYTARAWNVYDQGLSVAGKYQVDNRYTAALRARRDALVL